MKRVTEQLTAYYRAQGLTGEDLSAAVAVDAGLVRDNVRADGFDPDAVTDNWDGLDTLFGWGRSPEGSDYWSERNV